MIYDKPAIFKCVICGNEYPAVEKDINGLWKMPEQIETVQYKGVWQFRCIPQLHEELMYSLVPKANVG